MPAVDIIRTKRDDKPLSPAQIDEFIAAATHGTWPEYQLSALLMAIWIRGMSPEETAHLTKAMTDSGKRIDLSDIPGPKVDKHSTGGVGDKTSLILAPLAAACGVIVPMMSGRGLGHTGGTLDKLESMPGFRVRLTEDEFKTALRTTGIGMIGQTESVAPADRVLYALRDVTGTVESIPLITASILSKKIAEGISGLVLDVKSGAGAFMKTREKSVELMRSLVQGARANGLKCGALLTAMDVPLGNEVGNANEVIECIDTLKGNGPDDLELLSVLLAARMVQLAGLAATPQEAEIKVRQALQSGTALERFRSMVEHQGGNPKLVDDVSLIPQADRTLKVRAERRGFLAKMNAEQVGRAGMRLGAGRETNADRIDHGVGISVRAKPGMVLNPGDVIYEVRYRDEKKCASALPLLRDSFQMSDEPVEPVPLVLEELAP